MITVKQIQSRTVVVLDYVAVYIVLVLRQDCLVDKAAAILTYKALIQTVLPPVEISH